MASFLPDKDADLLAWALNFSTKITATPTAYGLVAAQATAFGALFTAYQTALAIVTDPNTKTKTTVATKNAAKNAMKISARNLAKIVEGTPTVTNTQKISLGLNVRALPSPVPAPAFPPNLDIVSVIGRTLKIKLHDGSSARRGKPVNVRGATVMSYVGATPPASVDDWKFEGSTTKTIFDVAFATTLAPGAAVWVTAFWVGTRMEGGPACTPVSVIFGGAGVSSLAA